MKLNFDSLKKVQDCLTAWRMATIAPKPFVYTLKVRGVRYVPRQPGEQFTMPALETIQAFALRSIAEDFSVEDFDAALIGEDFLVAYYTVIIIFE